MGVNDKPFACDRCENKYYSKHSVLRHKRKEHGEGHGVLDVEIDDATEDETIMHKCDQCDNEYASRSGLSRHKRNIHASQSQEINETSINEEVESSTDDIDDESEKKAYKCDQCDNEYASKKSVWRHKKNHHTTVTETKAKSKMDIKEEKYNEVNVDDPNDADIKCDLCDNVFASKANVARH